MIKYKVMHRLSFTNAGGRTQRLEVGDIVSFDRGDDVNVPSLLEIGAIEEYTEPEQRKTERRKLVLEANSDD